MNSNTPRRVLSLAEVADRLDMKRPNVAKFLARHGIEPAFAKASGYLWFEEDIERIKAQREADAERLAADQRRREAALRRNQNTVEPAPVPPAAAIRLGRTQREVLERLAQRPVRAENDAVRLAMRRLRERHLVAAVPGERGLYALTDEGRSAAAAL
jgi:hypothetical protein